MENSMENSMTLSTEFSSRTVGQFSLSTELSPSCFFESLLDKSLQKKSHEDSQMQFKFESIFPIQFKFESIFPQFVFHQYTSTPVRSRCLE